MKVRELFEAAPRSELCRAIVLMFESFHVKNGGEAAIGRILAHFSALEPIPSEGFPS